MNDELDNPRARLIRLDAGGKLLGADPEMVANIARTLTRAGPAHRILAITLRQQSVDIEVRLPETVTPGSAGETLYLNETARQLASVVAEAARAPVREVAGG